MANSYNRAVFAVSGRLKISGRRDAITEQVEKAALVESAADLEYFLDWQPENPTCCSENIFGAFRGPSRRYMKLVVREEELNMTALQGLEIPVAQLSALLLHNGIQGTAEVLSWICLQSGLNQPDFGFRICYFGIT
jgi:predicted Rossmann fold nucleotide-binding protein DprA/Smf involved in DNA uptake